MNNRKELRFFNMSIKNFLSKDSALMSESSAYDIQNNKYPFPPTPITRKA